MTKTEIIQGNDSAWIGPFLKEHWGADFIVSRAKRYDADMLTGARASVGGKLVGAVTWHVAGPDMQIVSLDAFDHGSGIGTALLDYAVAKARVMGLKRVWLVTTNDNLDALRFYQRRGLRLCAIHRDAIEKSREIKPQIPEIGNYGIPVLDEVELERVLG